ncbi:MAG: PhoX family phosphatase [Rubrobacteraceae bacterium]
MKDKSSVQQTKKEKRGLSVDPTPTGISRRKFLTFLGTGSAALAAGSSGILSGEAKAQGTTGGATASGGQGASGSGAKVFFKPIKPTDKDDVVLPEGFGYKVIRAWGDPVTSDRNFGFNNDYVAYFPIDALAGGDDSEDGILWVNHEYVDSKWVSGFKGEGDLSADQIEKEKAAVGGSVIRVRKEGDSWQFVEDGEYNRRIDAKTPMDLTGPAAGSEAVQGANEVVGTLANCSGGVTPWNTVLSCEENFQYYYGARTPKNAEDDEASADAGWLNAKETQPPEHYGWVVEIDPFDKQSKPRKHTWLGRIRHENVALRVADSGKVVAYTGHDQEDECIYKFVSSGAYKEGDRKANLDLLTDGMLYVADFANGKWTALDFENNPIFKDNDFKDQADVLTRTAEAVKLSETEDDPPIGTPMDRCEDIEVHPETGTVYCSLTNNENHGNFHGQVLRIFEKDGDPEATEFSFEVFAAGGPNTGFSSPDNLAFDNSGNLWVVTDISSSKHNQGIYTTFKNNGIFVMPAVEEQARGDAFQFASGPVESEMTGPFFTPDGKTLFLAVQHPGEESESVDEPTSTWPGGDKPKPAVIAITGGFA